MSTEISAAEARRLTLAAQGFGATRTRGTPAKLRKLASRLNAFQIDSVNVLVRAHYMPAFSRLGPYPTSALDTLAYDKRELFEFWGHAACLLPMENYPLFRWRMEGQQRAEWYAGVSPMARRFIENVYREVADNGPMGAGQLSMGGKGKGNWWGWSDGKRAMEVLFRVGRVAVSARRNFERLYDLTERVIPKKVLSAPAPDADESKKQLLVMAAKSHGIGTAKDIAGYFHIENWWDRVSVNGKRARSNLPRYVEELVEDARLVAVDVEGWKEKAYIVPGARIPREVHARALVSPFDPLLWERKPTQRIFGFDYQIEIYVPEPKRVYGYYVLPFLLGDRFAGRVDLKADRKRGALLVQSAWVEPKMKVKEVAEELSAELSLVASWLGLEQIEVGDRGDLAPALRRALR